MSTYKEYTDPDGNKYRILPEIWNNSSPITQEFVLANGWTVEQKEQTQPEQEVLDYTDFKTACKQFREVCTQIGTFIGKEDFKGGFDQYSTFISSEAAQNDSAKAALLASMWSGANEYCKYEGQKVRLGQPAWWYKCWEYTQEELNNN